MVHEWSDKVVVITGGAEGIGAEVVKLLMTENVKHVAILDIAEDVGTAMREELNTKYGKHVVSFIKCDVTKEEHLEAAFKTVVDEFGYIDVVINNAGIFNESYDTFRREIDINYTAVVAGTFKAIRLMSKEEGGRGGAVINVASICSMIPFHYGPVYSGTKAAVVQFSIAIGSPAYFDRTGVRVLSISFGATETDIGKEHNTSLFDKIIEKQYMELIKEYPRQTPKTAGQALIDAYKFGESGSVWISGDNKPVKDITQTVKRIIQMYQDEFDK